MRIDMELQNDKRRGFAYIGNYGFKMDLSAGSVNEYKMTKERWAFLRG